MPVDTNTDPVLCTLTRPAGMQDRTWTGETWIYNTPNTTFVALGERVWLLTAGSRCEWRCMSVVEARTEWKRLTGLGYLRSEKHIVDVVAVAELHEDRQHVMEDDRGLRMYRAGKARAGLCPVLRSTDYRYRNSSWSICLDVEITTDTTSVRAVGSRSVETLSIYGYDVATSLMTGERRWGCTFAGVSDQIGVERRTTSDGHTYYGARDIAA